MNKLSVKYKTKPETFRFILCASEMLMSTVQRCLEMGFEIVSQDYVGNNTWELTLIRH